MTDKQLMMKMDQVSLSKKLSTVEKTKEMAVLLIQAYFSDVDLLAGVEKKADGTSKPVGMVFEFREENQGRVTLPICFSSQHFTEKAQCRCEKTGARKIVDDLLASDYPGLVFNPYSDDPQTTRIIIPKGVIQKILDQVKGSDVKGEDAARPGASE